MSKHKKKPFHKKGYRIKNRQIYFIIPIRGKNHDEQIAKVRKALYALFGELAVSDLEIIRCKELDE